MGSIFRLNNSHFSLSPAVKVLKEKDYFLLLEAENILDAAHQRAAEIDAAAQKAYDDRKQEGYDDGVMEGRMEQAEKMMETALQAVEYIEGLEVTLVKVVTEAVRKVIGELPDDERIVRIVRTALQTVRSQQRVLVRVSPGDEPAVRQALAAMLEAPGGTSFMDVKADPRMNAGDCILESELGVVDASLTTQLKAIEEALNRKITQG